jgi:hypothetical protein
VLTQGGGAAVESGEGITGAYPGNNMELAHRGGVSAAGGLERNPSSASYAAWSSPPSRRRTKGVAGGAAYAVSASQVAALGCAIEAAEAQDDVASLRALCREGLGIIARLELAALLLLEERAPVSIPLPSGTDR